MGPIGVHVMNVSDLPQRLSKAHPFTATERLAFLIEWEKLTEPGERSAFGRRINVDTSSIRRWARQKRAGLLVPADGSKTRYVLNKRERLDYRRLQRENAVLRSNLEQSESAVEVLGKASELLASLAKSSQLRTPMPEEPPIPDAFRRPPPVE